jgi:hypothetical protein
MNNFTVVVQN